MELPGTLMFPGPLCRNRAGKIFLHPCERLVSLCKLPQTLLAQADAIENPAFKIVAIQLFAGGPPLLDGGWIIILEKCNIPEAGLEYVSVFLSGLTSNAWIYAVRADWRFRVASAALPDRRPSSARPQIECLCRSLFTRVLLEILIRLDDGLVELLLFEGIPTLG